LQGIFISYAHHPGSRPKAATHPVISKRPHHRLSRRIAPAIPRRPVKPPVNCLDIVRPETQIMRLIREIRLDRGSAGSIRGSVGRPPPPANQLAVGNSAPDRNAPSLAETDRPVKILKLPGDISNASQRSHINAEPHLERVTTQ